MKKILFLFTLILLSFSSIYGQLSGVHWTAEVYQANGTDIKYLNDLPIDVDVSIKDKDGNLLFKEHHTNTLDKLSRLSLNLGAGVLDPNSPVHTATEGLLLGKTFCYTIVVHDTDGDKTIMGSDPIGEVPNSLQAKNADALGGYSYNEVGFILNAILDSTFLDKWCLLAKYNAFIDDIEYPYIKPIDSKEFFNLHYVPSAVNGNKVGCVNLGLGDPRPIVASKTPVDSIKNYFTLFPQDAENYFNGLGVTMPNNGAPLTNATAAISGENLFDPMGNGVSANAANTGVYARGLNGVFGVTRGTATGYGVWGIVGDPSGSGQTKAGIFGKSQSNNNYSMMSMGRCVTTSAWELASDVRLKTNIQSDTKGLDKIMQLRPTTYSYIKDTPYQFAEGMHHGFIAQEVENVFPEIVSTVNFPTSVDPDHPSTEDSKEYKAIAYTELIPVLTAAIQELNEKVEAQAAEIEKLKKEIAKK